MSDGSPFSLGKAKRRIRRASLRAFDLSERTARWGWREQRRRVDRWRGRLYLILQLSLAAGTAYGIAHRLLGHQAPFLAPIAAIICLGFSFGQRLGRVTEVAIGVAIGVATGDLFVQWFGTGVWQIMLVLIVAMSVATWLGARTLMVTQSGVQAVVVVAAVPGMEVGVGRWVDALVGCAVALVLVALLPIGPIEKPRLQAAKVLHATAGTIRELASALAQADAETADRALEHARNTESALSALNSAVDEGAAVVRTSPLLRRHRDQVLEIADLVVPLDRFVRNLRVLARRVAVSVYDPSHNVTTDYVALLRDLGQVTDLCASELFAGRRPESQAEAIVEVAGRTGTLTLQPYLTPNVIIAQTRSMCVDLLELCGLDHADARDQLPDVW